MEFSAPTAWIKQLLLDAEVAAEDVRIAIAPPDQVFIHIETGETFSALVMTWQKSYQHYKNLCICKDGEVEFDAQSYDTPRPGSHSNWRLF